LSKYVIQQLIQNLIRLLKETELLFPTDLISIASSKEEIYSELLGIEIPEGVELVDEDRCSINDLVSILTSKDLVLGTQPIYLTCETTQFSYIISKLSQHFSNLTPTAIEQSNLFFSKKGNSLKRNNLYKNKTQYPKNQQAIDTILKGL